MRRRARIDANQPAIVRALEAVCCSVISLAQLGKGKPDLLVARDMRTVLMEIKNDEGKTGTDDSAKAQSDFARAWRGELFSVRNPDEAIAIMLKRKP